MSGSAALIVVGKTAAALAVGAGTVMVSGITVSRIAAGTVSLRTVVGITTGAKILPRTGLFDQRVYFFLEKPKMVRDFFQLKQYFLFHFCLLG